MAGALNIAGERFGRLTALWCSHVDRFNRRVWACKCDCGAEHLAAAAVLRQGQVKSCGCLPTGVKPFAPGITERNAVICTMKAGARSRGYSWRLSPADVDRLLRQNCRWCGAPPSNCKRRSGGREFLYSGVDRVDNTRGYEPDNVVPCCAVCNWMKRDLTVDEFRAHVACLYRRFEESA